MAMTQNGLEADRDKENVDTFVFLHVCGLPWRPVNFVISGFDRTAVLCYAWEHVLPHSR